MNFLMMVVLAGSSPVAFGADRFKHETCIKYERFFEFNAPDSPAATEFGCALKSAEVTTPDLTGLLLSCNQKKGGQNSTKVLKADEVPTLETTGTHGKVVIRTTGDCRDYEVCRERKNDEGSLESHCYTYSHKWVIGAVSTSKEFCGVAAEDLPKNTHVKLDELKSKQVIFKGGTVIPLIEREMGEKTGSAWNVYQQSCFEEPQFWDASIMTRKTVKALKKLSADSFCHSAIDSFWKSAHEEFKGGCKEYIVAETLRKAEIAAEKLKVKNNPNQKVSEKDSKEPHPSEHSPQAPASSNDARMGY